MKLGIAVVYLVDDEDEKLLDLHLDQIERNTPEPHAIYASANRLQVPFRAKLERHPKVKIIDVPGTDLRSSHEHAHYLEHLVAAAIADGATHVCTLHVDSFPIRRGWATELAARLVGDCVLASVLVDSTEVYQPNTALLLFPREFYLTYHPKFLPPEQFYSTVAYRRFVEVWTTTRDSGLGYAITMFEQDLAWLPLTCPKIIPGRSGFGVYGGVVFHLAGAVRARQGVTPPATLSLWSRLLPLVRPLKAWMPAGSWRGITQLLPKKLRWGLAASQRERWRTDLLRDPRGFLCRLTDGEPPQQWTSQKRVSAKPPARGESAFPAVQDL